MAIQRAVPRLDPPGGEHMMAKVGTAGPNREGQAPVIRVRNEEVKVNALRQAPLRVFPRGLALDGTPLVHRGAKPVMGHEHLPEEV